MTITVAIQHLLYGGVGGPRRRRVDLAAEVTLLEKFPGAAAGKGQLAGTHGAREPLRAEDIILTEHASGGIGAAASQAAIRHRFSCCDGACASVMVAYRSAWRDLMIKILRHGR